MTHIFLNSIVPLEEKIVILHLEEALDVAIGLNEFLQPPVGVVIETSDHFTFFFGVK
jgi:hypothetical protein